MPAESPTDASAADLSLNRPDTDGYIVALTRQSAHDRHDQYPSSEREKIMITTPRTHRTVGVLAGVAAFWLVCCALASSAGAANPRHAGGVPPAGSTTDIAFQATTKTLWVSTGPGSGQNLGLGMKAGTSPAIATLSGGGYEAAFQANTGVLWIVANGVGHNLGLAMAPATSPAITSLPGCGYEAAFQATNGHLWVVRNGVTHDLRLGMMPGTSPAITALPGCGYEAAFQANTGVLWVVTNGVGHSLGLGMAPKTSPHHHAARLRLRSSVPGQHRRALGRAQRRRSQPRPGHGASHQPRHHRPAWLRLRSSVPGQHRRALGRAQRRWSQPRPEHGASHQPRHHRPVRRRLRSGLPSQHRPALGRPQWRRPARRPRHAHRHQSDNRRPAIATTQRGAPVHASGNIKGFTIGGCSVDAGSPRIAASKDCS